MEIWVDCRHAPWTLCWRADICQRFIESSSQFRWNSYDLHLTAQFKPKKCMHVNSLSWSWTFSDNISDMFNHKLLFWPYVGMKTPSYPDQSPHLNICSWDPLKSSFLTGNKPGREELAELNKLNPEWAYCKMFLCVLWLQSSPGWK